MATSIARLNVDLVARTAKFTKGLKRASQRVSRFGADILRVGKRVAQFSAAVAIGAAGALVLLASKSVTALDALGKISSKLGIATEDFAGLQLAAEQTGNDVKQLELGLQRMTRRVSEAAQGMGEAQGALKELGIDAKVLNKLPLDKQFRTIAAAMEKVSGRSNQIRLAFKLFDSEGVNLIRTLDLGGAGLDDYAKKAKALGLAVDGKAVKSIERMNDSLGLIKASLTGVGNLIAVKVAPLIEFAADRFIQWATDGQRSARVVDGAFKQVINTVGNLADVFQLALQSVKAFQIGALKALDFALKIPDFKESIIEASKDIDKQINTSLRKVKNTVADAFRTAKGSFMDLMGFSQHDIDAAKRLAKQAKSIAKNVAGALGSDADREVFRSLDVLKGPGPGTGVKDFAVGVKAEIARLQNELAKDVQGGKFSDKIKDFVSEALVASEKKGLKEGKPFGNLEDSLDEVTAKTKKTEKAFKEATRARKQFAGIGGTGNLNRLALGTSGRGIPALAPTRTGLDPIAMLTGGQNGNQSIQSGAQQPINIAQGGQMIALLTGILRAQNAPTSVYST